MIGAVVYVRVSTKEQTENLSLPTQLRACEEYCRREGFEVLERFKEQGESAKTTDRTELQNLLKYCRAQKGKAHFVVVYNLTRFAREKYDHFALRAHLKSLGISLRSATEPIDDTSTGKLTEGVLASFAQFDNDVRSERTRSGMRAALELGRWTFLRRSATSMHRSGRARASCTTRNERHSSNRCSRTGRAAGYKAGGAGARHRRRVAHSTRSCAVTSKLRADAAEHHLHRLYQ
jgi:DNA invertase Pin-like site-specific DNA recombinase